MRTHGARGTDYRSHRSVAPAILRTLRDLMMEHRDDPTLLLTLKQGKPLAEVEIRCLSLGGIAE